MKKRFFSICSVLIAAIILVAVVPGCTPTEPEEATINVNATLCGEVYTGAMAYTLSATGEDDQNGTTAGGSHTVAPGEWTIEVSFGPAGAYVLGIDPSDIETVAVDATLTFTVNFEAGQDAWVQFDTWLINGEPVDSFNFNFESPNIHVVITGVNATIGARWIQGVYGCEGVDVTVNETATFIIGVVNMNEPTPLPPLEAALHVANNVCAVEKTAELPAVDAVRNGDQVAWVYLPGPTPLPGCTPIDPYYLVATNLSDAAELNLTYALVVDETQAWDLKKEVEYTKSVNWMTFGDTLLAPATEECVMFSMNFPTMTTPWPVACVLLAYNKVELVGVEDVNPLNNEAPAGAVPVPLLIAIAPPM